VKQSFILANREARRNCVTAIAQAPDGWYVALKPPTRSLEQNARMWAMLAEVSRQVEWYGKKLTPEAWKCVFSASLKKQDVVPGLHGDFVVIGQSTSQMGVREMGELMELMEAFGAERSVRFRAPAYMEEMA
jgi:hypothetical protein